MFNLAGIVNANLYEKEKRELIKCPLRSQWTVGHNQFWHKDISGWRVLPHFHTWTLVFCGSPQFSKHVHRRRSWTTFPQVEGRVFWFSVGFRRSSIFVVEQLLLAVIRVKWLEQYSHQYDVHKLNVSKNPKYFRSILFASGFHDNRAFWKISWSSRIVSYFLNGVNLLKFCQKGDWLLLGSLNSKTSACAMPSATRYCPGFMGSPGGGYAGGTDLWPAHEMTGELNRGGGGGVPQKNLKIRGLNGKIPVGRFILLLSLIQVVSVLGLV